MLTYIHYVWLSDRARASSGKCLGRVRVMAKCARVLSRDHEIVSADAPHDMHIFLQTVCFSYARFIVAVLLLCYACVRLRALFRVFNWYSVYIPIPGVRFCACMLRLLLLIRVHLMRSVDAPFFFGSANVKPSMHFALRSCRHKTKPVYQVNACTPSIVIVND